MKLKHPQIGKEEARTDQTWLEVIAEPKAGNSDAAVMSLLASCGAERIEYLAPGFIGARISVSSKPELELLANVEEQAEKRFR